MEVIISVYVIDFNGLTKKQKVLLNNRFMSGNINQILDYMIKKADRASLGSY